MVRCEAVMYELLIAEDNAADYFLLEEALRTHEVPCQIHWVQDTEAFLAYANEVCEGEQPRRPDMIVVDWTLPPGSGLQLLSAIRKTERCADSPLVVLTSSISPTDRRSAEDAGATLFLSKPSSLDEYLEIGGVLKRYLASSQSR